MIKAVIVVVLACGVIRTGCFLSENAREEALKQELLSKFIGKSLGNFSGLLWFLTGS